MDAQDPIQDASSQAVRRTSFRVREDITERLRNAAWWLPGVTLSAIANDALREAVERLERDHNGGVPFEKRGSMGLSGRPIGT